MNNMKTLMKIQTKMMERMTLTMKKTIKLKNIDLYYDI